MELLEAGVSFQSAYEQNVKSTAKSAALQSSASKPTSNCLSVNIKESEKKLASTPMGQKREYFMEQRLCWNCLKPGNRLESDSQSLHVISVTEDTVRCCTVLSLDPLRKELSPTGDVVFCRFHRPLLLVYSVV